MKASDTYDVLKEIQIFLFSRKQSVSQSESGDFSGCFCNAD